MQGIVLSRRDFREFDQIISLYTKEKGKVEALARGVKKITSKNSGSLEPFSLVEIEIIPGKEIDHVTKVQALDSFKNIRENLSKILMAHYVSALVSRLVAVEEKDERIFNMLESWLRFVNGVFIPRVILIPAFVLRLLQQLGLKPEFEYCVHCKRKVVGGNAARYFDIGSGGLIGLECLARQAKASQKFTPINYGVVEKLRVCASAPWSKINELESSPPEMGSVSAIVCKFVLYHTGYQIPNLVGVDNFIDSKK